MHLECAIQREIVYAHFLCCRFIGVSRSHTGKWTSAISIKGRRRSLGDYLAQELAAQAYDRVCIYQASVQPQVARRSARRDKLLLNFTMTFVCTGFGCSELPRSKL